MKNRIQIEQHDKWQLEIKVEYPDNFLEEQQHELCLWFALPMAAAISPSNYNPEAFFDDFRGYTRLQIPDYTLEEIGNSPDSPLYRLENRGQTLSDKVIRQELRLFVSVFQKALRIISKNIQQPEQAWETLQVVKALLLRWRAVITEILHETHKPKTMRCAKITDEMLSVQMEVACIRAIRKFHEIEHIKAIMIQTIQQEKQYRVEQNYHIGTDITEKDNLYLLRLSNLKKYIGSILFLEPKKDKWADLMRHLVLGLAAGVAMAWALFAQLFTLMQLGINPSQGMQLSILLIFVLIGVFSYILKDRIKATSSAWLLQKLSKWMQDRRYEFFVSESKDPLAVISDRMAFVTANTLPSKLEKQWNEHDEKTLSVIVDRDILKVTRNVKILRNQAIDDFPRYEGLVDIQRLHFARWSRTFADPQKTIFLLNKENKIKRKKLTRIYEIDLGIRLRSATQEEWCFSTIQITSKGIVDVRNHKHFTERTNK